MQVALVEEGKGTQTAWDYHQPGLVVSGGLKNGRYRRIKEVMVLSELRDILVNGFNLCNVSVVLPEAIVTFTSDSQRGLHNLD